MHNYKQLEIWKLSRNFSVPIYKLTATFPESEKFGLISQLRRASISVPSNIAEGSGRNSDKDFIKFLQYAVGSCREIDTQLLISCDLNFATEQNIQRLTAELKKVMGMISNFIQKLKET